MIFLDARHNETFEKFGYIRDTFLNDEEIKNLQSVFHTYLNTEGEIIDFAKNLGYYISVFDSNLEKRAFINEELKKVFSEKIEHLLNNYKILYGNFMYKDAGGKEIEVHQDFSFVDEKIFTAFNLWVPLQDTAPENGGFHLIEASNKLFNSYRGATIPHNLTHYNEAFKKLVKPVEVKAGEGLLFDHRLFHYSTPNQTDNIRVAVQMVVIPKEATPIMYYYQPQKDKHHLEIYEITEDFLLTENLWSDPTQKLKMIDKIPYESIPDARSILKKLNAPEEGNSPIQFLKKLFSNV